MQWRAWFSSLMNRQMVRPWALCAPILVLLNALPLLRPLRSPDEISANELSRLATIQSLVEHKSLSIDHSEFFDELAHRSASRDVPESTVRSKNHYFSDKPPVMAFLLSWAYEVMHRFGWNFERNPILVAYVLTLLGVTLPVAAAAGLIYRMGRMFELKRPKRALLAVAVVMGSGLISYATVLNPHAPAAALVLAACACLFHITASRNATQSGAWLMICGLCASLAAVIDPSAGIFLVLLACVIPAIRWNWIMKVGGVVLYAVGAVPPLLLHAMLTMPVTGDVLPGFLHTELANHVQDTSADDLTWQAQTVRGVQRTLGAILGSKGLLTHYPVVLMGLLGIILVLRRHWPGSTKMLAVATLAGAIAIIGAYVFAQADWSQAMFGPRWFIVFLPLLVFWAGAWLRKSHRKTSYAMAAALLIFSMTVSLIGAAAPFVDANGQYTVVAAMKKIGKNGSAGFARNAQRVEMANR
jgi:hypothetical protein